MAISREVAMMAAEWWAQKLRNGFEAYDTGLDELNAEVSMIASLSGRVRASVAQIKKFKSHLADTIQSEYYKIYGLNWDREYRQDWVLLKVDCDGPRKELQDALNAAGIEIDRLSLPIDTAMWVEPNRVRAKKGVLSGRLEVILGVAKRRHLATWVYCLPNGTKMRIKDPIRVPVRKFSKLQPASGIRPLCVSQVGGGK